MLIDACDINVSPDKRTIFIHSENNLILELKVRPLVSLEVYAYVSNRLIA